MIFIFQVRLCTVEYRLIGTDKILNNKTVENNELKKITNKKER